MGHQSKPPSRGKLMDGAVCSGSDGSSKVSALISVGLKPLAFCGCLTLAYFAGPH